MQIDLTSALAKVASKDAEIAKLQRRMAQGKKAAQDDRALMEERLNPKGWGRPERGQLLASIQLSAISDQATDLSVQTEAGVQTLPVVSTDTTDTTTTTIAHIASRTQRKNSVLPTSSLLPTSHGAMNSSVSPLLILNLPRLLHTYNKDVHTTTALPVRFTDMGTSEAFLHRSRSNTFLANPQPPVCLLRPTRRYPSLPV